MILKDPCSLAYISAACNSNPFAADWGPNNLICVAVEDTVAILQPELVSWTMCSFPFKFMIIVRFRTKKFQENSSAHYLVILNEWTLLNGFTIWTEHFKTLSFLLLSILQRLSGSENRRIISPNTCWRVFYFSYYILYEYLVKGCYNFRLKWNRV